MAREAHRVVDDAETPGTKSFGGDCNRASLGHDVIAFLADIPEPPSADHVERFARASSISVTLDSGTIPSVGKLARIVAAT